MGPHCVLRSVLRQDTITLTKTRLTLDGAPLRAEVSAATGTTIGVFEHGTPSPNSKRSTCHGASLHAEVSAVTGPLPTKLSTTVLQWGPIAC